MGRTNNQKLKKMVSGGAVGVASSVFGGGGGMLAVPMLKGIGLDEKGAHATAILLILPVAFVSFLLYAWRGIYDGSVLIPTAIGVAIGGAVGAKLLEKLSIKAVTLTFAVLQLIAGIFLFFF